MTVPVEPGIFFWGGGCQQVGLLSIIMIVFCANEAVKYLSWYNFVYMHTVLNHRDFFKRQTVSDIEHIYLFIN